MESITIIISGKQESTGKERLSAIISEALESNGFKIGRSTTGRKVIAGTVWAHDGNTDVDIININTDLSVTQQLSHIIGAL